MKVGNEAEIKKFNFNLIALLPILWPPQNLNMKMSSEDPWEPLPLKGIILGSKLSQNVEEMTTMFIFNTSENRICKKAST